MLAKIPQCLKYTHLNLRTRSLFKIFAYVAYFVSKLGFNRFTSQPGPPATNRLKQTLSSAARWGCNKSRLLSADCTLCPLRD